MKNILLTLLIIIILISCKEKYTPKPRGYFRIDFPVKKYSPIKKSFSYSFDIPDYAKIIQDPRNTDKPGWIKVTIPANKAEIHISYYDLQGNKLSPKTLLQELMEESRSLAYKHTI